ncbi:MAG: hypothetical protein KDD64_07285 [Bdellovibrionales bacterium]|nr:hypothetical protein [Bdellovibrionales bacterium]
MTIGKTNSSVIRGIDRANQSLQKSFTRLSSGSRINKASDDAAGLAIVSALEADAATSRVASRNAVDAQSFLDIQQQTTSQLSEINVRQQELAIQASNGTLSDEQRASLDQEFQALSAEAARITSSAEFNGVKVFGSQVNVQVGNDSSGDSTISTQNLSSAELTSQGLSIADSSSALASLDSLKQAQSNIAQANSSIGAVQSRLSRAEDLSETKRLGSLTAASRIRDADVAEEVANTVAANTRLQIDTALNAQSNLNAGAVLRLLK